MTISAVRPRKRRTRADLRADVAKPYAEQGSFPEIELAARRGESHRTCSGRALNDDVMDTVFTLLVNGRNGPVIRDGIDRPSMLASHGFPYLVPLNPDPRRLRVSSHQVITSPAQGS